MKKRMRGISSGQEDNAKNGGKTTDWEGAKVARTACRTAEGRLAGCHGCNSRHGDYIGLGGRVDAKIVERKSLVVSRPLLLKTFKTSGL